MTRVCIPTAGDGGLQDTVGEHFGRVPSYTLVNVETGDVEVVSNTSEHFGGIGLPADILSKLGIDVLLCRGAGRRALDIFASKGIQVYLGADGSAEQAIARWQAGDLISATPGDACQQHTFHDPGKHSALR